MWKHEASRDEHTRVSWFWKELIQSRISHKFGVRIHNVCLMGNRHSMPEMLLDCQSLHSGMFPGVFADVE